MKIKFKKLSKDSLAPIRSTEGAAAFDLFSIEEGMVRIDGVSVFDTGIAMNIPKGHVGLLFGRSGLAFKESLQLANAVGVIDEDYTGSIKIGLVKHNKEMFTHIKKGDRIGQIMFVKLPKVTFEEVKELEQTKRGANGIGSTGKSLEEVIKDFHTI